MESISALRYIDALYYNHIKEVTDFAGFREHVAIGKIFNDTRDHIGVSFVDKNDKPFSGLLLPKSSLHSNKKKGGKINFADIKEGDSVGVYWTDITRFDKGEVPDTCTKMYTEGFVHLNTKSSLAIKDSKTLKIRLDGVYEHPENNRKIPLCVIPLVLITNLEKYG